MDVSSAATSQLPALRLVDCGYPQPPPQAAETDFDSFAFVEYESRRDADDAYHEMHNKRIGRDDLLKIEWARTPPSASWRFDSGTTREGGGDRRGDRGERSERGPRRDRSPRPRRSTSPRRGGDRSPRKDDRRERDYDRRDRDRSRSPDADRDREMKDVRDREDDRGDRERSDHRERDRENGANGEDRKASEPPAAAPGDEELL
ncbi:hypothetical protein K505DRAFT_92635 [Melanomma pulvis-pyrius CBS 109.77]|uniref:RRM domain-containing protein n=1 Tax=Melanomma pulvis-pyrius CBS 109.77 TaxID=1314802 RepID=A0A6A6WZL1_9PLEO|nr:hypothetical protein K505DRAFT_92635 [Melanomma pulvis-pyrius CBS 109.77]